MLEMVANALRSPHSRLIENSCGHYQNEQGDWGYYLTLWHAGHYHMISVSHITAPPKLSDIAAAITSPLTHLECDGRYLNRKGTLGYYATAKGSEHWYMISVSDIMQPFHRQWWGDRVG